MPHVRTIGLLVVFLDGTALVDGGELVGGLAGADRVVEPCVGESAVGTEP